MALLLSLRIKKIILKNVGFKLIQDRLLLLIRVSRILLVLIKILEARIIRNQNIRSLFRL